MQLLKELCVNHGAAAIVIIHQPDGYVFSCFNRLLLVSRGRCVYSDDMSNLGSLYDNHFGCRMPESKHEVPLDLMRRLKLLPEDVEFPTPDSAVLADQTQQSSPPLDIPPICVVPFHRKFFVVFQRNLMNHYVRNVTNLCARLFCYTAISLLDGAIFWKVGENGVITSAVGAFTFVILASYLLPFTAIPVFVHEKKFFLFEINTMFLP